MSGGERMLRRLRPAARLTGRPLPGGVGGECMLRRRRPASFLPPDTRRPGHGSGGRRLPARARISARRRDEAGPDPSQIGFSSSVPFITRGGSDFRTAPRNLRPPAELRKLRPPAELRGGSLGGASLRSPPPALWRILACRLPRLPEERHSRFRGRPRSGPFRAR